MLCSAASIAPSIWHWPATSQPRVDLFRLRKAVLYADIIEAGGIAADAVDRFTAGQWSALALIAKGKPPSPKTCVVIRRLVHQRQAWRDLVARESGRLGPQRLP